jgi:hypothetical protein
VHGELVLIICEGLLQEQNKRFRPLRALLHRLDVSYESGGTNMTIMEGGVLSSNREIYVSGLTKINYTTENILNNENSRMLGATPCNLV